jgi:K+-sensing histidine kinase KdpD
VWLVSSRSEQESGKHKALLSGSEKQFQQPTPMKEYNSQLLSANTRGMGMGLSICRSIIEAHHGRIWVSPVPEFGSVFEFALPTSAGESSHA